MICPHPNHCGSLQVVPAGGFRTVEKQQGKYLQNSPVSDGHIQQIAVIEWKRDIDMNVHIEEDWNQSIYKENRANDQSHLHKRCVLFMPDIFRFQQKGALLVEE